MKTLGLIISFFYTCAVFGQIHSFKECSKDSASSFKLSFTTFNHAERIFKGTTTYLLTDTSIKIINTSFGEKEGKVVFSKSNSVSKKLLKAINNIRLDSLKESYFNHCIMATSGNEYFLDFENTTMKKHISLHHYYLKQLDGLIQLINSTLPQKYQFRYLTKDIKQDCTLK